MRLLGVAGSVCALGCAGNSAAFNSRYPDNRDSEVALLLQRVHAAPPRQANSISVGLSSAPIKLFAFDLAARRLLWQKAVAATSAPHIAGDTVVLQTGDAIAGFDLHSGTKRFEIDRDGMSLKGSDGENGWVALTVGRGQGTFAKSAVIMLHDGSEQWRRPVESLVGVPAVVGAAVLVPWSNQFLSALDARSGTEFARIRVNDGVISHAFRDGDQLYLGSFHGITRVTPTVGSGRLKGPSYFSLPDRELPGRPLLLDDVYTSSDPPAPDSAQHRIALAWQPAPLDGNRTGLLDDSLYLAFYRFVFALNPHDYAVRWVYVHDRDIVGVTGQAHGVVLADEAGHFGFLGAGSGDLLWKGESGVSSTVASMPAGGVAAATDSGSAVDEAKLAVRLMTAAQDTDARMVPARLLAVAELARLQQAEATADLIELCDSERLAPSVRERACTALKQRTIGADHLLAALQRHAAFLEGTSSPPVGALAKAAASIKEKRAVGPLIAQLKDPGTRSSDLPALVIALGELGDPSAAEPLADFLRLYHADPIDEHLLRALEAVPDALVKLNGPVAQPVLESVGSDELCALSIRQKARAALDALAGQQAAAEKHDQEQQRDEEQRAAEEMQATDSSAKLEPLTLTTQVVDQVLLPVRDPLLACMQKQKRPTFQARVLLVVDQGQVAMVSILPKELQSCMEPLIRSQKFPSTRNGKREQLSYLVKR
jgi:outer membrane protein assembly factor BamB